jgi:polyferredoxin
MPASTTAAAAKLRGPAVGPHAVHDGFDVLRLRGVRALIVWPGFPYVFQTAMLAVFVGLAMIAWGVHAPVGVKAKLFAKTNLATLMIWGVWWPAMVWIAVLFGRVWCTVCPLELVSNVSERIARALTFPQRPLRRWMASGTIIFGLYALIQMLVAGAHINRVPAYTSWFLIGLLTMALVTGLVFKDRAFCRAFCPVGLLLGTYGRSGMLAVRAGSGATCQGCTGQDCIVSCNRTRLDARSCPSLLNPPKLNSNRDCLICGQCIKACKPDNMQLLLRRPFPASDFRESVASWPVNAICDAGFWIRHVGTVHRVAGRGNSLRRRAHMDCGHPRMAGSHGLVRRRVGARCGAHGAVVRTGCRNASVGREGKHGESLAAHGPADGRGDCRWTHEQRAGEVRVVGAVPARRLE